MNDNNTILDQSRDHSHSQPFADHMVVRSPLRYPGGKFRAIQTIRRFIPSGTPEICSPFFGGGSIELSCAASGIRVHGYDVFAPLVEFWRCVLTDAQTLANITREFFPLTRDKFYELQRSFTNIGDPWTRAGAFYALNRASFSGTTLSGGMSPSHPRFTSRGIANLGHFSIHNVTVKRMDFRDSIAIHPNTLLYLDPPYLTRNHLYGQKGDTHRGFDHADLRRCLDGHPLWILSYNDCPEIRDLYAGYAIVQASWSYGMTRDKRSREIVILSPQLKAIHGL